MKFIKKNKVAILVFIFFVCVRLFDLGHDNFNTDVWKWKARTYDFGTGVFTFDFIKTLQKYHPGVTLMWLGVIGVKIFSFYNKVILGIVPVDNLVSNVFLLHTIQKTVIVSFLGFLVSVLYTQLRHVFGKKYALLAIVMLSLEPFYIAFTRVMHLEGLMSTLMVLSFILLFRFLQDKTSKHLYLSAVFAGLAFLTKTSSLYLIPFTGLVMFIDKNKVINFIKWLGVTILVFVVLWPVMYTHPLEAIQALYRGVFTIGVERSHIQLFMNNWVEDPGYLFYPVVLIARTSLILMVGILGFFAKAKNLFNDSKKKKFFIYSLIFIFFYMLELSIPSKKLDRYVLPAIMVFSLLSTFFYLSLTPKFKQLLLSVGFVYLALTVYLHPNYLSYYSPIVGGLDKGLFMIESKWMIGQPEIVEFFNRSDVVSNYKKFGEGESIDAYINKIEMKDLYTIAFKEKYYTQIWPFINEIGGRAMIKDITIHAQQAKYFVYPVYDDDSNLEDRVDLEFFDSIKLRGVNIYNVYKVVQTPVNSVE